MSTNKQQVREHLNNDEQFEALSQLIKDVAVSFRMYRDVPFFLWAQAHTMLIENGKGYDFAYEVIANSAESK